ncbi:MAG: Gfo/Idh/MocA family oxidoreductase [Synergistaceae bacterium]|jgi:predicted dehydrogenase|nr:Gfo/Idh/MocA family oxidoreductase [Synergistaceae bacterium]
MRVAVVGYGAIAARHIDIMEEMLGRGRLDLLVCRERDVPLRPEHGWARMTTDFGDVLDFAPRFAVVASPATKHAGQAARLAEIGAHMLIEKPLSASLDGIAELIDTAEARGLTVLVAYNMSYLKTLNHLMEQVRSGAVGRVISVMAEVGQYLPRWRPHIDYRASVSASSALGGGVLLELSHEVEYADRLLGGTRAVFCRSARSGDLDIDVEDSADILMEGAGGSTAMIHLDMLQRTPTRSCRVFGTDGAAELDLIQGTGSIRSSCDGGSPRTFSGALEAPGCAYRDQMAHFLACVRGESEPLVGLRRGMRVVELVEAARRSAEKGERVLV